jgi:biliverdin reductase
MYNSESPLALPSVRVGLVGTGNAAKLRAKALLHDPRSQLVAVAGNTPDKTQAFAENYQAETVPTWQQLIERADLDLIVISHVNSEHSAIAHAALSQGKHVVVEYPLALDVGAAEALIALAKAQNKLLHVEHIEILGGLHQTIKQNLGKLGKIFYVRYSTINPQNPAPRKWTYNHELFGFPLIGALSRLHRLTDLFGQVFAVNCHQRYWQKEPEYYQTCFCIAQLSFESGLLAQVVYGKGETLWQSERKFEVHGENGGLIFDGDTGFFIQGGETTPIEIPTRRGSFAKDTSMVLDHIFDGTSLYVTPEESLYTLRVAEAAKRAAETGLTIFVKDI